MQLSFIEFEIFRKLMWKWYLYSLKSKSPQAFLTISENRALQAFRSATEKVPAYKAILHEAGVDPLLIKTIQDFKEKVPIIDKATTFIAHSENIRLLCTEGNLDGVGAILSSSGLSGNHSYGLLTERDLREEPHFVDFALDMNFNIVSQKTLLINCLPMGVKVPSRKTVVADISVRKDIAVSLVRGFGKEFVQIIMVGENSFIKEVLEFGINEGIKWPDYNVRIIVGEEPFPESYRSYIASLLGVDVDSQTEVYVGSSMGVSELALTVFQENLDTIRIRREAEQNETFRHDLFGADVKTSPMLFSYYPTSIFLEEDTLPGSKNPGKGANLIFTTLNPKAKIPLIRYATGDCGCIIPYDKLQRILEAHNLSQLLPRFKLPLVALFGRNVTLEIKGEIISPEDVKAAIYEDFQVAASTTGNFKMKKAGQELMVKVQLKKGLMPSDHLSEKFSIALSHYIKAKLQLTLYTYEDFPYPIDFERKFHYFEA